MSERFKNLDMGNVFRGILALISERLCVQQIPIFNWEKDGFCLSPLPAGHAVNMEDVSSYNYPDEAIEVLKNSPPEWGSEFFIVWEPELLRVLARLAVDNDLDQKNVTFPLAFSVWWQRIQHVQREQVVAKNGCGDRDGLLLTTAEITNVFQGMGIRFITADKVEAKLRDELSFIENQNRYALHGENDSVEAIRWMLKREAERLTIGSLVDASKDMGTVLRTFKALQDCLMRKV